MIMNQVDKGLLLLVKYAVDKFCEETLTLKSWDWTELIALSNRQCISAFVADGLQTYLTSHPKHHVFAQELPAEKMKRLQWIGYVVSYERMYAKHESTIAELARIYEKRNIDVLLLKGYGLSLDWPIPNHRAVGDLDMYNFGKWKEADSVVEEVNSIKVDNGHEHHTIFSFHGVPVENHYDFINTKAHRDAPVIESRLKSLAKRENCKVIDVQGAKIYLPSADFNAIFLMRHMGQHFAGEHLNLRQVLDWGFFVRAHHEKVNWNETIDFLKEVGLYTFFNQINAICVDYLGFAEDAFPAIERRKELETRILADILHPEFPAEKPSKGLWKILTFKLQRWWHNRWKHPLVYREWLLPMFLTLLWSHLRRYKTIKD